MFNPDARRERALICKSVVWYTPIEGGLPIPDTNAIELFVIEVTEPRDDADRCEGAD